MSAPRLGPRLAALAARVPDDVDVADLGCDHAHLAIALAAGSNRRVIAADVAPGAVRAATDNRDRFGETFDIRRADGSDALHPGEVTSIVIAGVGGHTMTDMLGLTSVRRHSLDDLGVTRLVLQPQAAAKPLRRRLSRAGWRFRDEAYVVEGPRMYAITVAVKHDVDALDAPDDLDAEFGPWARRAPTRELAAWLDLEIDRLGALIDRARSGGASPSRLEAIESRRHRLDGERRRVEALLPPP